MSNEVFLFGTTYNYRLINTFLDSQVALVNLDILYLYYTCTAKQITVSKRFIDTYSIIPYDYLQVNQLLLVN